MISARGVLAIAVAAWFLVFVFDPFNWIDEDPPAFIVVICSIVAGLMFWAGLISLRFVWRRYHTLQTANPVAAEFRIRTSTDSDETMFTVDVRLPAAVWRIAVVINKASSPYADGQTRPCQAWLHPRTRDLLSLSVSGRHMNTLPIPQRIAEDQFGVPA